MKKPDLVDIKGIAQAKAKQLQEAGIHTVQEVLDATTDKLTALPGFSARVVTLVKESAGQLLKEWSETLTPEKPSEPIAEKPQQKEPAAEKPQIQLFNVDSDDDEAEAVVLDDDDEDDDSAPIYLLESSFKVKKGKKGKKASGEKKSKKKKKAEKEPEEKKKDKGKKNKDKKASKKSDAGKKDKSSSKKSAGKDKKTKKKKG